MLGNHDQMPLKVLHSALLYGDITLTMKTPEGERIGLCGVTLPLSIMQVLSGCVRQMQS